MGYGSVSLEKRIKENIKDYSLGQLLDMAVVQKQLEILAQLTEGEFLLTRRHGEPVCIVGNWPDEKVDVMADQGIRIRVNDRTVAHFYYRPGSKKEQVDSMIESMIAGWQSWAENTYLYKETDQYVDELSLQVEEELNQKAHGTKLDALTGTLNHTYFHSRMKVMDRSQVAPVAALCVNINDWRYANDHFGVEESDRLIRIVADILKKFAKPDYLIGRVDGDVFNVLIPVPEPNEAEEYMQQIRQACDTCEDEHLAPSVAVGIAMKYSVEEELEQVFSDAEYEMLENKMAVKQAPGYQERLEKVK
ncbi:MAG: GGDEF domain-containing protein [Lachnospiraceae bacterium]|nr:GGDEF domain-containing protein [Lachnospiraceae bacterium]